MKYISEIFRSIISLLFFFSVVAKLLSFNDFNSFIETVTIFNEAQSLFIAQLVITIEFFCATMLALNLFSKGIYLLLIYFLSILTVFSSYILITGSAENCQCFGNLIEVSPIATIIKNSILIFILLKLQNKIRIRIDYKDNLRLSVIFLVSFIFIWFNFNTKQNYFIKDAAKINKVELKKIINSNLNYVIIDVRTIDEYNLNHIENAINIAFNEPKSIEKRSRQIIDWIQKKKLIIVYCDNRLCGLSEMFAREFKKKYNYENIMILTGGIRHWLHD